LYLDTGDPHRAEDLTQETLLLAFRSVRSLTDPAGFRPWLLTIAHNVLVDSVRKEARQKRAAPPRSDSPLAALPASTPPPEDEAQRAELRQKVLAVLRGMPEEYRLPLTLRYIAGADYEAIATQLG